MEHDPHSRSKKRPSDILRHVRDLRDFAATHRGSDVAPAGLALLLLRPLLTRAGEVAERIEEHIYTLH
jgi:hypothetical protein